MAVQCLHPAPTPAPPRAAQRSRSSTTAAAFMGPRPHDVDDGAGVDTVRALQHLQSRLARLDRERHEADSCAAALREDIAARELDLARLAAEADAADASDDGTVDDEDDEDDGRCGRGRARGNGRRGGAAPRRGPAGGRDRPAGGRGRGGARPAASGESRRPAASDESRAAYRGARAAKERAAPARRDRRAPAVEFVRTAGHLRGRGALDAGAAAPAGAGPSFFLGLSRAWHTA